MTTDENTALMTSNESLSVFSNQKRFAESMAMARALTSSTLVPVEYRGEENLGNALIALEMAQRTSSSPLMVMQNLYIVHGRPGWSAQFIIAALNACGRFSPLRFDLQGEGSERTCMAWAQEFKTGERLEGPAASIAMAMAEGWLQKKGSKWASMPELMLRYRAAAFFGRLYAPDLLMGMQTAEELRDVIDVNASTGEVLAPSKTPVNMPRIDALRKKVTGPSENSTYKKRSAKKASVKKAPKAAPVPTRSRGSDPAQPEVGATMSDTKSASEPTFELARGPSYADLATMLDKASTADEVIDIQNLASGLGDAGEQKAILEECELELAELRNTESGP